VFWFSLQLWKISHSKKNWAKYDKSVLVFMQSRPTRCSCQILTLRVLMSYIYIYIYIYDISSLKVNDLTLILLTWRKWWANNASNYQIGFNSGFKGLMKLVFKFSKIHTRCHKDPFSGSWMCHSKDSHWSEDRNRRNVQDHLGICQIYLNDQSTTVFV
jgi:hypothetical protein